MLQTTAKALKRDTCGASFMEYIVLVGLIAVVCIGVYQAFGKAIGSKVEEFGTTVAKIPGS